MCRYLVWFSYINAAAAGRLTFRTSGAGFGTTDGDWEWYAFMVLPPSHTQYNDVQLSTTVSNSAQQCPTQSVPVHC